MSDILRQLTANLIPTVSGGAYQDAREVSIVWNTRRKHRFLPKFRCRMHQTRPSTLFSPVFSLAREKIGPPEARQKRPRRNEPPQATSLILCARFFLSKPQTEFAVWVFLCKSVTTSQSRLRRAIIPTPFVPSGHFPLIGGIGPWKGSQGVRAAGSAYQRRNTRRALDSVARATSSAGMPRRSAIFLATYGTKLGSQRRPRKGSGAM